MMKTREPEFPLGIPLWPTNFPFDGASIRQRGRSADPQAPLKCQFHETKTSRHFNQPSSRVTNAGIYYVNIILSIPCHSGLCVDFILDGLGRKEVSPLITICSLKSMCWEWINGIWYLSWYCSSWNRTIVFGTELLRVETSSVRMNGTSQIWWLIEQQEQPVASHFHQPPLKRMQRASAFSWIQRFFLVKKRF